MTGSRTVAKARTSRTRMSYSRCSTISWRSASMLKVAEDTGDPDARAWFKKTMERSPDDAGGKPFTPLERFVMELFRVITPNGGSISALTEVRTPPYERHGYVATPHASTSLDPVQWKDPDSFKGTDKPRHRRNEMRSTGL